jgi:iron complex outermembrane recepter protein
MSSKHTSVHCAPQLPAGRLRPLAVSIALLCGSAAFLPASAQVKTGAQGAAVRSYDIPAGALNGVLNRFAAEAGVFVAASGNLTDSKQSPGLRGSYSAAEALSRLLSGTGLEAVPQANGSYALRVLPAATLPEVKVTASADAGEFAKPYEGGQLARGGKLGILGASNVMDTPFSTSNYTAQLMEDQQARTLLDVVVNDSSVRTMTSTGGFGEDFQIRGFTVPSGDVGMNGLYGLASASRLPTEIMERVEVLKGPGSFVNGIAPNGSIGGGINVITKRAGDVPLTRLTATYMGRSQPGVHLDVGRRFGEDNEWGVRLNGVWRDGESSIKDGNQKVGVASIGLDYRGRNLRWSLDAFTQKENIDGIRPQIGFGALTSIPKPPNGDANWFLAPGEDLQLKDSTIATRFEYDFSDQTTAHVAFGYRDGKANQIFPWSSGLINKQGDFQALMLYYDSYSKTNTFDTGISHRFGTGSVGHTLVLGYNQLNQELGSSYNYQDFVGTSSNIYNPVKLPAMTVARYEPIKTSDTTLSSVAIADTMSFNNDRLLVTVGLRDQRVDVYSVGADQPVYKKSALSPLAGIVFKPVANVSLYGNYTEGLTKGDIVGVGFTNTGSVLSPYKSTQYEAGVKTDWGKITTIASVFQISKPNATGVAASVPPVEYGYNGEQRNRGLELSAYGELQRGLRFMGSATFNDAELTSTEGGANDGNTAPLVAKRNFNLGADWDTPWVTGLSLNGRLIYSSPVYANDANTQRVDDWTRVDVGARYRTVVAGKAMVLRATVQNLFDKNYWLVSGNSFATVGAPRTYILSATVDF